MPGQSEIAPATLHHHDWADRLSPQWRSVMRSGGLAAALAASGPSMPTLAQQEPKRTPGTSPYEVA